MGALFVKPRLPIFSTLAAAYREWRRALSALRPPIINAFIILTAVAAVGEMIPQRYWDANPLGEIMSLMQTAIRALLLAPIVIAIHRFVILGEVRRAFTLPLGEPVFWTFFVWLFVIEVLIGLPFEVLGAMQALDLSLQATTLGLIVALIVAAAIVLRLIVLLPAIAVGAPGASPAQAIADTKGQALRILAIVLLAVLPWFAANIASVLLLGRRMEIPGSPQMMIGLVMGGVLQTVVLSLTAVIASLAFIALGAQVRRAGAAAPRAPT